MKVSNRPALRLLSLILTVSMLLGMMLTTSGISSAAELTTDFVPAVSYDLSVTDAERAVIHEIVDDISGWTGADFNYGDGTYDPNTLLGAMLEGSSYDSISYGNSRSRIGYSIPTEYPFRVPSLDGGIYDEDGNAVYAGNRNEGDRKAAKFAWVKELAENMGFDVVVQRQDDKYVYVEIGDPDAPEMIMGLSHLDSPSMSVSESSDPSAANNKLPIWVNSEGEKDETAYHTPYVKDGWIYGAGMQDDSGPTLATLVALKALLESGLPMDRRIRIVMGAYEDENPGVPTAGSTQAYADIPYYSNPSFYDNWCYKYLNREEIPISAYTSDSRFPVVVANTGSITPYVTMDLSEDATLPYHLISAKAGITQRTDDPTLKDIITGSTQQIASRAIFTLSAEGISEDDRAAFVAAIEATATAEGWLPAVGDEIPKVQIDVKDDTFVLEINTGRAMEMPTPQYSLNAVVWGMYLLSENLPDTVTIDDTATELALKAATDGFAALFYGETKEGEAYIGKNMGIPADLLREPNSGAPNMTIAPMCFSYQNEAGTLDLTSFYVNDALKVPFFIRYLYQNAGDFRTGITAVVDAVKEQGFGMYSGENLRTEYTATTTTWNESSLRLYLSYDNPLTALQFASYKASMNYDPSEFEDIYDLLDITTPMATTGGILASDYPNKMTSFGAVIPGNERWWHAANERMKVDAAIEMTKIMADGMLEMARYTNGVGAQFMWADMDGLNADRADLDLLDVTIDTYADASSKVTSDKLPEGETLLGATQFAIDMWKQRGFRFTNTQYELGHEDGGVYLPLDNEDFQANTFVLPMRLEFKVERPAGMGNTQWNALKNGDVSGCTFNILKDGEVIALTAPEGQDASKYFSIRYSEDYNPDAIYISVNLAIVDDEYDGVEAVLADSKTDLFKLNDEWLSENENPFPERGQVEERGFFKIGDGAKNACFESPDAVFVSSSIVPDSSSSSGSSSSGGSGSSTSSTTTKNPDGSTTTITENKTTGTVTETTKNPDGSQTVVETKKDGTVTTTETDKDGNKTATVANSDGSSVTTVAQKDGTSATVTTDVDGNVEAEVKLATAAVSQAQQSDGTISLPIPQLQATKDAETAPEITVNTGSKEPVKVEIPVTDHTPGTVAILVKSDGTEEVIKTSVSTEDGVVVELSDGDAVKLVDNSKSFADVPAQNWANDAIDFVSARELFSGTSKDTFSPEAPMTRAMLMTVLARFDGADTSGGTTWYEKGMDWAVANKVSDGSDPDGNITREQLVTMLWRYAGSPAASGDLSRFHDGNQTSSYAQDAVKWAVEKGIISGFGNGQLEPQGQATRAQVAQILKNYIEK